MKSRFKIAHSLLQQIREDLLRPHPFAHERVGFILSGFSMVGDTLQILAKEYRPVQDEDYLKAPMVGAMMGPEAIRKALQWSLQEKGGMFHVHMHAGKGIPRFSRVDLLENAKFVPDFFKVSPAYPHGAVVLSENTAAGQIWLNPKHSPMMIETFTTVGLPIRQWRVR